MKDLPKVGCHKILHLVKCKSGAKKTLERNNFGQTKLRDEKKLQSTCNQCSVVVIIMTQFKTSLFAIYTTLTREKQLKISFDNIELNKKSFINDVTAKVERGQTICDDSMKDAYYQKRENGHNLYEFA